MGAAIRKSGIPRDQIFLTTKLWNNSHHPDDVEVALDASLKRLGTDYLDLYLMHWPSSFERGSNVFPKGEDGKAVKGDSDYVDVGCATDCFLNGMRRLICTQTYKAMEKTLKSGKTRAIGISNYSQAELECLLKETSVVPAVHQLELHPYLQQKAFVKFHKQKGIHITQYSPYVRHLDPLGFVAYTNAAYPALVTKTSSTTAARTWVSSSTTQPSPKSARSTTRPVHK